jgi:hypothetical protein
MSARHHLLSMWYPGGPSRLERWQLPCTLRIFSRLPLLALSLGHSHSGYPEMWHSGVRTPATMNEEDSDDEASM